MAAKNSGGKTKATPKKQSTGGWIVKHVGLAAGLIVVLIGASYIGLNVLTKHNDELPVPDFTNMSVDEAEAFAAEAQMRVEVTDSVYVKRMARGAVYRQNPIAGSHVKKGRRILLTINAITPKSVSMPNLVGYSMRQAKAELLSRGLHLGKLIYIDDIATNNVLRQYLNGEEIEPGTPVESESVIDLEVGLNDSDATTYVPYILGTRYLNAVDAVHEHSLNIRNLHFDETVLDYSDSLDAVVYRQIPEMSETPLIMGSEIVLYLSKDLSKVPPKPEPVEEETEEEDIVVE